MCEFLGTNPDAPLSVPADGLGEGSVNGDTRNRVAEQMDQGTRDLSKLMASVG